jgi:hypothetical protein
MIRTFFTALLLTVLAPLAAAQTSAEPTFPRLGLYSIGAPHNYEDPARQADFSKFDVVILNVWPNWESGRGTTMENVVRNIKARNGSTKVFLYVASNELDDRNTAWPELKAKLDNERWWLYESGGAGNRVKSTWGDTHFIINNTDLTRRDGNGDGFLEWFTRHIVDKFYRPNPSIDGFFLDNAFWKPRVNGDWNRDGVMDDQNSAEVRRWTQEGLRKHMQLMKSLMPGKLQIANIADWGGQDTILNEITGVVDGGILEHALGNRYSPESWGSWSELMRYYRKTRDALTGPKMMIFNQEGDPSNYRDFRYGFATCLMDDGYYFFSPGDFHRIVWFDEFDVDLGRALSPPSTRPWQSGVYRRDYEKGIVLVNPKGNPAADLQLEADFQRIRGSQDPATNNGQITRTVRLQERDGLVLLRTGRRVLPMPPSNLAVE